MQIFLLDTSFACSFKKQIFNVLRGFEPSSSNVIFFALRYCSGFLESFLTFSKGGNKGKVKGSSL